uniref:Uncharacterized protein n=1 Tax=Arundo donax TaxID=35708 RepID=A0A0A9GCI1_ARUDO
MIPTRSAWEKAEQRGRRCRSEARRRRATTTAAEEAATGHDEVRRLRTAMRGPIRSKALRRGFLFRPPFTGTRGRRR